MIDIVSVLYKPQELEQRLIREVPLMTRTSHTFKVFDNSENYKNLSMAWNDMANGGQAPFIAFLHSDVVVSKGWEEPLIECLNSHPDVGAALANPARFDFIGKTFNLSNPPTTDQMGEWSSYAKKNMKGNLVTFAVGAGECAVFFCVVIRRRQFEELKGFDERFRFAGNNHEFQWRLNARGLRTVIVTASSVWHQDATSFYRACSSDAEWAHREGVHWEYWKNEIKSGRARQWHSLSSEEREAIRRDPKFRIGS